MHLKWIFLLDVENRLVDAEGKGEGGGTDWESGLSRCKRLPVELAMRSCGTALGTIPRPL